MSAITRTFNELKGRDESALIAYITVGDPAPKHTPRLVSALIEGGADIVELGIPFSDPIADGPTIQAAVKRSLTSGARPLDALHVARTISENHDTPLVLMTYYNPIFRFGLKKFLALAKKSEISGMIVPDLPVEESADYKKACVEASLDTIFLASPSTGQQRLKEIVAQTSGYLYLISLFGVTGVRRTFPDSAINLVKQYCSTLQDSLPLAVGFGISQPEQVRSLVRAGANGVIVGSAFVEIVGENSRNIKQASTKLTRLARKLKQATVSRN